jgi:hypothetical protein
MAPLDGNDEVNHLSGQALVFPQQAAQKRNARRMLLASVLPSISRFGKIRH